MGSTNGLGPLPWSASQVNSCCFNQERIYSLKQKEVQWKGRLHKGLVDSALQGRQQESRFFPSRPGWSSTLTSSSGGQQAAAVVGGSSRKHPGQADRSFPGFKGRCSFPLESPADTSSPSTGQSQITWPILNQSLGKDGNQINPTLDLGFGLFPATRVHGGEVGPVQN